MMLNKKSFFAIYLLHKVHKECVEKHLNSSRNNEGNNSLTLDRIRLDEYLANASRVIPTLNNKSLLALFADLNKLIRDLQLPEEIRLMIPDNQNQFNAFYQKWSKQKIKD